MGPIVVYIANVVVALAAIGCAAFGKATWTEALLLVTALLTPSAAHIAVEQAKEAQAKKLAKKLGATLPPMMLLAGVLVLGIACKPATGPIVDADSGIVEAGVATVTDVCSLIEGVDDNGAVRTICATVEEVIQIIAFVLTLRQADAGAPASCSMLPGTTFCATSLERAKAILFIVRERQARFLVDGGAP